MNTSQPIRTGPSAFTAGARAGRRHLARTAVIRRQLDQIAPGTAEVRTVPVTLDGEPRTWVVLLNDLVQPIGDSNARLAAIGLLSRAFPGADWSNPQTYTVRTGHLTPDAPTVPAALGIDTAEAAR
ncbi:hypothetical protein OG909_12070 [Streptomyces sp. NBC_01754]|uniref:hypothetical protein n=1 Tax=Streptomyces sp. NBC_01754 TaxID=2975930 RepID=UPI002DDA3F86|nr:hypothetical protein [Streptomyces sp. NBC_01754]WSC92970.1 hypothetical protein OG909_12070 [Streptomyces sp. NBC_01754]